MCADGHGPLEGRWKCVKQEKFDSYLGAHGINFITRKLVNQVPCTVEVIKNEDGSWTVKEITAVRTAVATYHVGIRHTTIHPVTEKEIWAIVVMEDGKIVGKCLAGEESDEFSEHTTKELLEDGRMLQYIFFKDIVCKRWFVKEP